MTKLARLHKAAFHALHRKITHHCYCVAELIYLSHHMVTSEWFLVPVFIMLVCHAAIEWIGDDA